MCRAMPFSARALKKKKYSFDVDIGLKNKPQGGLAWPVLLLAPSTQKENTTRRFSGGV